MNSRTHLLLSFLSLPCVFISTVMCGLSQFENQAYLPLTKNELRKGFPVHFVGSLYGMRPGYLKRLPEKRYPETLAIGISGARLTMGANQDLSIMGKDSAGRQWDVEVGEMSFGCGIYVGDLDNNGIQDIFFVIPTGGNGLAPTNHFVSLTFDEQGAPFPFEADGYFEETEKGIKDLVDLDSDKHAELICMNFDDGYWITNIYRADKGRWALIKGEFKGRQYPIFTRFTYHANHTPVTPEPVRHPFAPDLSTVSPTVEGQLQSYRLSDKQYPKEVTMQIASNNEQVPCTPVAWHDSFKIVMDGSNGRKIKYLTTEKASIKSLLDLIVRGKYKVVLFGSRCPGKCCPEILWAQGPQQAQNHN